MLLKLYLALIYSALAAVGLLFLQTGHWPVMLLLWGGNALPAVLRARALGDSNAD